MITNISTGKYIITESNVVYLTDKESDLILHFKVENDFEFDFKFTFVTDSEDTSLRLQRKIDGNVSEVICTNFNNPFGTGTTEPLELANIDGKKLYIQFWSFLLGSGQKEKQTRKVEYTVLLER